MERSKDWEDERYVFERLKQTQAFKEWKDAQFDCQRGRCAWCEKPMMYNNTETDHVKPLYYGGTSDAKNLVICCHRCNEEKSTAVGFIRPEWITENCHDSTLNEKYTTLKDTLLFGSVYIKANALIDNYVTKEEKKRINAHRALGAMLLFPIIFLAIMIVPSLFINSNSSKAYQVNNGVKATMNVGEESKSSSVKKITTTEEDQLRITKMQSILSEYNKYYKYWVLKKGYNLPRDASKCGTWNGCNLSFPLGNVKMPGGYTYSINSLANGVILSSNGQSPNATRNNIALYKRARCSDNGVVIGGTEAKDAAVVVGLSNGTYYCVQN